MSLEEIREKLRRACLAVGGSFHVEYENAEKGEALYTCAIPGRLKRIYFEPGRELELEVLTDKKSGLLALRNMDIETLAGTSLHGEVVLMGLKREFQVMIFATDREPVIKGVSFSVKNGKITVTINE